MDYEMLCSNREWEERFHGYLQGKKTLPLLYDPFFKAFLTLISIRNVWQMELLQEFHLISLDTFKKYRYSDIINNNVQITKYDFDENEYNHIVSDD